MSQSVEGILIFKVDAGSIGNSTRKSGKVSCTHWVRLCPMLCGSSWVLNLQREKGPVRTKHGLLPNPSLHTQLQVPGNIYHHDARIPAYQQKQLQQLRSLVVEGRLPPVFDHEFGNQDGDLTIGMVPLDLLDVLDQRCYHEAIR